MVMIATLSPVGFITPNLRRSSLPTITGLAKVRGPEKEIPIPPTRENTTSL